jgi:DNA polymerase-3 subunit alpha (Gram-positive type)
MDNMELIFGESKPCCKNIRESKGKRVETILADYCVVDLETTSYIVTQAKICEVSAIRVRDGEIVGTFSELVNPRCHIPKDATEIHHITDDMVANKPCLNEIIDSFLSFMGDDILVGYNIATYDVNIIYDQVRLLRNKPFTNDFLDLLYPNRRALSTLLDNCRLETVSNYWGLNVEGEHRALKDCYLTKECYDKLVDVYGDSYFVNPCKSNQRIYNRKVSHETEALGNFNKLVTHILSDGDITKDEINALCDFICDYEEYASSYPFSVVISSVKKIQEDGIVDKEELSDLLALLKETLDPVSNSDCEKSFIEIKNKHICVTGMFEFGTRDKVFDYLLSLGAVMDNGVSKKTDILLVGEYGSDSWKTASYGGKIQKAMQLKKSGLSIDIIGEKEFYSKISNGNGKDESDEEEDFNVENFDWKSSIIAMLDNIVHEMNLPSNSLSLSTNKSRDGLSITSYSVSIYEPEYPISSTGRSDSRNSIVLNIKDTSKGLKLLINIEQYERLDIPQSANVQIVGANRDTVQVLLSADSSEVLDFVETNVRYVLKNYKSKASSFGCCSYYVECSNFGGCIHENMLYSKACQYREHLENGRIFYGDNPTV